MKIASALAFISGIAGSSAFAPTPNAAASRSTSLNMAGEKVPCFGATPLLGGSVFVGETEWDLLTTKWGTAETGTFLRAAELKHGRSAMLATVGFAFHKLGITLNNISPHEYLSVTQNIKFADLAAMTPPEAMKSLPVESMAQMFCAIAAVEIYELTHRDGELKRGERVAPGLQAGGLTGDLGWNPLNIEITDRRRLVELQNGRAAMFAICAWVAHDTIPGSVPLPLPWN
eukprot:CAMPEP_0172481818 /NCGR_PEP_ID=MMETSP1066-20121228/7928_1 /TAXON_ID=671091 /ORGANISM="Coscinodiscus wailesii, Strain CCMP2513" /LENGTH=229 /DNA_ID=CAMNT_0013244449 /DNA_START=56 /DNA_END=745 /DNA_ORIENTATION=-